MNPIPTKVIKLITSCFVILLSIACSKDSDLFTDLAINDPHGNLEQRDKKNSEAPADPEEEEAEPGDGLVAHNATFTPINDVYIQESQAYDESVIRLEEGLRTSYLMFDLSAINSVEGLITDVELQLNVELDDGSGEISIYKGMTNNWSEEDISQGTAPKKDILLGTASKTFELGTTEAITLSGSDFIADKVTLILSHSAGNDIAFASKEHSSGLGPKLKVTYRVLPGTAQIDTTVPEEPKTEVGQDDSGTVVNAEVEYFRQQFDAKWADEYLHALSLSTSGNVDQEYYYLSYYIDGLTAIWQATGDNTYLDQALTLIFNTVNDAQGVADGLLGWPTLTGKEHALWDSFYWRHVATLMRIMSESPSLLANGNYRSQLNTLLNFTERNIWNRYENYGVHNFYRSRTHMASHWARIGMELYIITGNSKYKVVADNITQGTMEGRPSNLKAQIFPNPANSSAYVWDMEWDVPQGSSIQDSSHAGAVVSYIVAAYENGMYFNKSDIDALIVTLDEFVWPDNYINDVRYNVDGSGGGLSMSRIHEWLPLGRFSSALQAKIKKYYTGAHLRAYGSQALGIAALNAKVITDQTPVYPEY